MYYYPKLEFVKT